MKLGCQKGLFSIPSDVHYLNCATLGPLNIKAEQAGMNALLLGRNPLLRERSHFFEPVHHSKNLFGQLINASASQIAIIPSVSYGMATVAQNISLSEKEEVLVLEDQFPSNFYIWKEKCQTANARLKIIKAPDSIDKSKDWTSCIIDQIRPNSKILAMSNVHWMDGTYFDLEKIGKRCREYGTYLIIDGTQSVGALPFDVDSIKPDALIVASYKWLLSSYGLGYAYFSDRMLDGNPIEINWINKMDSDQFENLTDYQDKYLPGASRYSMGEQSNFIAIAIANASLELLNQWKPESIQLYAKELTADGWLKLKSEGILLDLTKPSHHITGLRFDHNWNLEGLRQALAKRKVVVSRRGNALRVSVNIFNDQKDIDQLVDTIMEYRKYL